MVVPRERPYKYGFALHLHFFPYAWSLHGQFGYGPDATITNLGDWFYEQDMEAARRRLSVGGTADTPANPESDAVRVSRRRIDQQVDAGH